jgi:hypothetical protein
MQRKSILFSDCVRTLFALLASYLSLLAQSKGYFMSNSISPFRRPFFLMLVHKKEGKEQDTPSFRFFLALLGLPGVHRNWLRPLRLTLLRNVSLRRNTSLVVTLTSHTERGLLRNSDSRWPKDSRQPCVARRGRWGPRTLNERNGR